MVDGIPSRKRKVWVRKGCGLKKASIAKANRALVSRGLLVARRRGSREQGYEATEFEVNWQEVGRYVAESKQQTIPTPVYQRDKPLVYQKDIHNHYLGVVCPASTRLFARHLVISHQTGNPRSSGSNAKFGDLRTEQGLSTVSSRAQREGGGRA